MVLVQRGTTRGNSSGGGADYWPMTTDGQPWRMLTCTFVHFDPPHLILNMVALWVGGRFAERLLGHWSYLSIYIFSGLTGSIAGGHYEHHAISAGASGSVFGVYGALAAAVILQRQTLPPRAVRSLLIIALAFIGYNLTRGLAGVGIGNAAHLGGLAGGALLGAVRCHPLGLAERPRAALLRFSAGVLVAAAVLVVGIGSMPRGHYDPLADDRFNRAWTQYLAGLNEDGESLVEQWAILKVSNDDFVSCMEVEVIPHWVELESLLVDAEPNPDWGSHGRYQAGLRYARVRREHFEGCVRRARGNNLPFSETLLELSLKATEAKFRLEEALRQDLRQ